MLTQEQDYDTLFVGWPKSSKIWIFQANRVLSEEEASLIGARAKIFVESWESHGNKLKADFALLHGLFLVFVVNEGVHEASGCSVDKSVHFVKSLQVEMGLNFFDRTVVAHLSVDSILCLTPLSSIKVAFDTGLVNDNSLIFNNLVNNLGEFLANWKISAGQSWLTRFR